MNKKVTKKQILSCVKLLTGLFLSWSCLTSHAQTFDWAKASGDRNRDEGRSTAADANGNVYVTGNFSDTADFNPGGSGGRLTAVKSADVFLAKYDASGGFLWAKAMGGKGADGAYGVAVDGSGNVYLTGFMQSDTADFNPGGSGGRLTSAGSYDAFLAKYDADGNYLWAKSMGGSANDEGKGLAVDRGGNAYVTGYFNNTADFNPGGSGGKLNAIEGGIDMFLVKYDAGGNLLWAKSMGGSNIDYAFGVAVDDSSNTYVTGHFSRTANFNFGGSGDTLASAGDFDAFVAKYDARGGFLWVRAIAGRSTEHAFGVAVDGKGDVYVTGDFYSQPADFNPGGNGGTIVANKWDGFLVKYEANGSFLWAKAITGGKSDYGTAVVADRSGNVYATGYFNSDTVDFNPGSAGGALNLLATAGGYDAFLVKYDVRGNVLWTKTIGGSKNDNGYGLALDGSGNVYTTGYFNDTATFDRASNTRIGSRGSSDIYLVKFLCSDTFSSYLAVSTCESYTLNDSVYTTSGTYRQIFPNIMGCDSSIILDLKVFPIDKPVINVHNFTLGVNGTYSAYQWLLDNESIAGANDSTYTISKNGNYQVVVNNENGCSDTSDVYIISNISIKHTPASAGQIRVYPNPAEDLILIKAPAAVNVTVKTIDGRVIRQTKGAVQIPVAELTDGFYMLHIADSNGALLKIQKIIKIGK